MAILNYDEIERLYRIFIMSEKEEEEDDFNKFVRETREASGIQPPKHENCISVFTIGTLEDKTRLHWHGDHPYIYTYRRETGSIEAALLS